MNLIEIYFENLRYALCMSVCFETHGHEDKFWNLGPMPTVQEESQVTEVTPKGSHR